MLGVQVVFTGLVAPNKRKVVASLFMYLFMVRVLEVYFRVRVLFKL